MELSIGHIFGNPVRSLWLETQSNVGSVHVLPYVHELLKTGPFSLGWICTLSTTVNPVDADVAASWTGLNDW
jgi:hypothetical protein